MNKALMIFVATCVAGLSQPAMAYVGPGAGLSLLGALWGLLLALGAAVVFLILWPWRRYRHKRAQARQPAEAKVHKEARTGPIESRRESGPRSVGRPSGSSGSQAHVGRG